MNDRDQAALLYRVVEVLEEMGIHYMIGGSMAFGVWAAPRMTHDIDVVVDLPLDRIDEFCAHFPPDRYYIDPAAMAASFRQRDMPGQGMYSFVDMETSLKVDLFPLRNRDPAQVASLAQSVRAQVITGQAAMVYAPADLLVQKLRWYAASGSQRQFARLRGLDTGGP